MSSLSDAEDDHGPDDAVREKVAGEAPENDNPAARGIDALHGSASHILRQISELADETEISFGANGRETILASCALAVPTTKNTASPPSNPNRLIVLFA